MKVKITRPTRADGKSLLVGKSYELSQSAAKKLIAMNKAVAVKAKAKAKGKDADNDAGNDDDDDGDGGNGLNTSNSSSLVS